MSATTIILAVASYYIVGVYVSCRASARFNASRIINIGEVVTWSDLTHAIIIFWFIWPILVFSHRGWNERVALVFDKPAIKFGKKP